VLRSIDREGHEVLETTSVFDNVEPWLVKEWIDTYGKEKTKAIVEASMSQSPIFLSVNHAPESTEEERRAKVEWLAGEFNIREEETVEILPHGSIRVPTRYSGSIPSWPLYDEGEWWVQDASATLPAIALSNGLLGKDDQKAQGLHVVDLCSAPGGKTAQLCSLGFGKVTAVDVSQRRTKPLKDNLNRLKMNDLCKVVVADGCEWKPNDGGKVHGVLVDAPCSATGVGSRRPDVLRKPPNLDELTLIQRELAAHTADELLEPGGIMVYATCSLLKQESEDQMKWLLSRSEGADMETIPFVPGEIPGFDEAIDENGWLRVIPGVLPGHLSSCDGFFVARLRRL
jgi:16S rRNA (cytosine967-C5)-methyltransferase